MQIYPTPHCPSTFHQKDFWQVISCIPFPNERIMPLSVFSFHWNKYLSGYLFHRLNVMRKVKNGWKYIYLWNGNSKWPAVVFFFICAERVRWWDIWQSLNFSASFSWQCKFWSDYDHWVKFCHTHNFAICGKRPAYFWQRSRQHLDAILDMLYT